MQLLPGQVLTAAELKYPEDFRLSHPDWGKGSGARRRTQNSLWTWSPPAPLPRMEHSSRQLPALTQHAAFSKKELATSTEHTAVETPLCLWPETMGVLCLPATYRYELTLQQLPQMNRASSESTIQIPTGVSTQVWCIPTPISTLFYPTTSKVTQIQEWGKRVPSVSGHFRRQPSFSSPHSWLKHSSHMMQIIDFHKELHHKLRCFKFYLGKLFCSDMPYARSDFEDIAILQGAFVPIRCHPLVWLPTCRQGCSTSQNKELMLTSTATQKKLPQTSAFVTLPFLGTRHEVGLKA